MVLSSLSSSSTLYAFYYFIDDDIFRNDVLQKPRNYFLINLAITDLGLLLTNSSLHAISSFKRRWIFGQAGIAIQ